MIQCVVCVVLGVGNPLMFFIKNCLGCFGRQLPGMIYTFNALFRPPYATDTECSRRHLSDFEKQFELCFLEIKERKVTMVPHNDTAVTEHVGASGDLL